MPILFELRLCTGQETKTYLVMTFSYHCHGLLDLCIYPSVFAVFIFEKFLFVVLSIVS